jgi:hypothetical protein
MPQLPPPATRQQGSRQQKSNPYSSIAINKLQQDAHDADMSRW